MKTKYTLGEWIAVNGNVMLPTPDEKGDYKLIMQGPRGYNGKKFTVQEIDANARLIAASPDLIKHGTIAAEILRGLTLNAADREVLENLDAAISKANGVAK